MKQLKSWKNKTEKKKYLEKLMDSRLVQPRDYDMKNDHDLGEHITHPNFGFGFIERIIGKNKIVVFFEQFEKVLLQNWTT